jgi:hypothetical protein
VLSKRTDDSLIAEGWILEKSCRVPIDTGASVTIAKPNIAAEQPQRKPSRPYVLQTASGETLPLLKEEPVELPLGRRALCMLEFVAEITDEFNLGLDDLRACDVSVELGDHMVRLGREMLLWRPGARPRSSQRAP